MNEIFEKNLKMISRFETIPSGWNTASIKELCDLGRGRVISQDEIDKNKGIYPVYSSQTLNNGEMGKINTWDFNGEYVTWTTDGANAGTVFYRNGKFNCTNVCGTLSAKDLKKTHMKFLAYHLGRVAKNYVSYIGNPKLMNNVVAEIALAIPSYKEQKRIAEILTNIDKAIEKTEQLIDKYKKIKQGLMQDLFTRGVQSDGKLRPSYKEAPELYQETDIGLIPIDWEVHSINDLGQVVTGSTPATNIERYYNGNYMFISPFDITDDLVFIKNTEKTLTYEGLQQTRVIPENSICVVCIGSTIGKIAITTKECATNQQINTLVPHCKHLYKLYYYLMEFYLKRQLQVEAGLQAVPIVNKSKFEKMMIPIPCDEKEQKVINETLTSIDKKIESENLYLNKLNKVKQALMQDLLTGKVRVKIEGDGDE